MGEYSEQIYDFNRNERNSVMAASIDRAPYQFDEFREFVNGKTVPIYIFGADIAGKVTEKILRKQDIKITGFLDNNRNKCSQPIDGISVYHTPHLSGLDREAIILIASTYISDIINQLENLGFFNWIPIAHILEANRHENFSSLLSGNLQQNHAGGKFTKDFIEFSVENMVNSQMKYLDPDKLFIRSVDLIVTEKCTLKCKDCSNLMQYYEKPVNIGSDELLADLEDLCSIADEVNEIRIIGGEPMVNKDFHTITMKAAAYPNVNKVVIYTNGTICPPEEKIAALNDPKVFVFVTTYGSLSRNEIKLTELLDKHEIQYNNQPAYGWTDCAEISTWSRNEEGNREIFKNCCAKHFTTLTDGKIFRCPFSANVERLTAIPDSPTDYVSIRNISKDEGDVRELRRNLRWFLREKLFLDACDSCSGRTYGDPEIIPGIQTKKGISYTKFGR